MASQDKENLVNSLYVFAVAVMCNLLIFSTYHIIGKRTAPDNSDTTKQEKTNTAGTPARTNATDTICALNNTKSDKTMLYTALSDSILQRTR